MGIILLASAIPTGLTGLVNTATGLTVLRFFIGIGGSTFVMAQYWYAHVIVSVSRILIQTQLLTFFLFFSPRTIQGQRHVH